MPVAIAEIIGAILGLGILSGSLLTGWGMYLRHKRYQNSGFSKIRGSKKNQLEGQESLSVSELKDMIRDAVIEGNLVLEDKVQLLEKQLTELKHSEYTKRLEDGTKHQS